MKGEPDRKGWKNTIFGEKIHFARRSTDGFCDSNGFYVAKSHHYAKLSVFGRKSRRKICKKYFKFSKIFFFNLRLFEIPSYLQFPISAVKNKMPFTFLRSRQLISANILDWGQSPNPCETLLLSTDSCGSAEAELDYTWALFNNPKSCFCEMRKQKPNKFARKTTWATESQSAQILYLHVIMKFSTESNKGLLLLFVIHKRNFRIIAQNIRWKFYRIGFYIIQKLKISIFNVERVEKIWREEDKLLNFWDLIKFKILKNKHHK